MPDEREIELFKQHRITQDKLCYLLFAIAGGGIALALNRTQEASWSWGLVFVGLAILLWGASFFTGYRMILYDDLNMAANVEFLRITSGRHAERGQDRDAIAATANGILQATAIIGESRTCPVGSFASYFLERFHTCFGML